MKKLFLVTLTLVFLSISSVPTLQSSSFTSETMYDKSYDLLIITPTIFSELMQPFIDHKNYLGIYTFLKTTEEIYIGYSGVDEAEQIKYCIKDMIETQGINYVLLVGNESFIPIRYSHLDDGSVSSFPSDLYYADIYKVEGSQVLFEDWDSNGNGIFAEWTDTSKDILDLYPDVYVGRIPCRDETDFETYINKLIGYELNQTAMWFSHVLLCGGDSCISGDDVNEGEYINEEIASVLGTDTFTFDKLWASTDTLTSSNITNVINSGVAFIDFSGGGQSDRWQTHPPNDSSSWIPSGGYTTNDALSLTNGNKLPLIMLSGSSCCAIDAIESTLAESFLFNSNGGSIGVVGATDKAYVYCDEYCTTYGLFGYIEKAFFTNYKVNSAILGNVWSFTLVDYINHFNVMQDKIDCKTVEECILLGDPSLRIGGYAGPFPIINIDTGEGFNSIQAAIDDPDTLNGHTIQIGTGIYYEHVIIDKAINLFGANRENTIIDGSSVGDVLTVIADNVRIMNLSIQHSGAVMYFDKAVRMSGDNCTFAHNIVLNNAGALYVSNSANCTLESNIFSNSTHDVYFYRVNNSKFSNNTVTDCRLMYFDQSNFNEVTSNQIINTSGGFYVSSSSYNTFKQNNLSHNGKSSHAGFGLLLEESSCFNNIESNRICNNTDEGMWLYFGANNNTITKNDISLNEIGIFFGDGIVDNRVFHNNFHNNRQYNARDYGVNIWDNGYPSGGNYWSDYAGCDADLDGIGDTSHEIVGGSNQDVYPLMHPYGSITNLNTSEVFYTIQSAIDDADTVNGHTIYVKNGTYYENVNVNKTIELCGEQRNSTIIDGSSNGNVLYVTADGVCISDFIIQDSCPLLGCFGVALYSSHSTVEHSIISSNYGGIHLDSNAYNCSISGNIISDNECCGIWFESSHNNTVMDNTISHNEDYGIALTDSYNNTLARNNISNNEDSGIDIDSCSNIVISNNTFFNNYPSIFVAYCTNSLISGNSITYDYGMYVVYSDNNTIAENHMSYCDSPIIMCLSNNNTITSNIVINNTRGVMFDSSYSNTVYNNFFRNENNFLEDNESNIWNVSRTPGTNIIGGPYLGGNYWSDYYGYDTDADGIGDVSIPYGPGDYLPLTNVQLEVNQSTFNRGFPIRHTLNGDWGAAQSFMPTLNTLTSAEIYMRKFGTPEFNLTVELRQNHPQGTLVDTLVFTLEEVGEAFSWFVLDFADTAITPDVQYFIVLPPAPSGVTTSFGYEWGYAFGNQYDGGAFWFTRNSAILWRDLPTMYEFCFKLFGYS